MRGLPARLLLAAGLTVASACGGGPAAPAALDTRHEACRSCRMPVSDAKVAAQIAAPGEEAVFFDDIGCLRDYLSGGKAPGPGAVAYVADHRTGAWIPASEALYDRCPSVETPMGSHLVAHADAASRASDAATAGCAAIGAAEIFGPAGPPGPRKG